MAWTFWDLRKIENYTGLIVVGQMTIEQVPVKYQEEVKIRVENWFKTDTEAKDLAAQNETL